jgi:hypothetical protein
MHTRRFALVCRDLIDDDDQLQSDTETFEQLAGKLKVDTK